MKRLNEKVIMMVRGLMIGSSMAAVLTVLVMGGKLGIWGFISVLGLIVLAGLSGWMIGFQTRTRLDADQVWLKGYKEGRQDGCLIPSHGNNSLVKRGLGPSLMQPPDGVGHKP